MKTVQAPFADEKGRPPARNFASAPDTLCGGDAAADEHRLGQEFRDVVKRPLIAIGLAAYELYKGQPLDKNTRARAFAELAVTGELSNRSFEALATSGLASSAIAAAQVLHGDLPNTAKTRKLATDALTYARRVSVALRAKTHVERAAARKKVPSFSSKPPRYVAVSGEDDAPDRPVNIPCTAFDLDDLFTPVRVRGVHASKYPKLRIRFARTPLFNDKNAPIVVLVHGLGSQIEENEEVMRLLEKAGVASVAMDLPCQGYSARISFSKAGIASDMQNDGGGVGGPFRAIEFYEFFIRSFVETLDERFPAQKVKQRIALLAGGSQGGTMSLRIAYNSPPSWLPRVAPWSPGSVWQSFHTDDVFHQLAVGDLGPLSQVRRAEDKDARRDYIRGTFEPRFPTNLFIGRIADTWWRDTDNYESRKNAHIKASRAQRHEQYGEWYRRWCSAMEQEQLAHSFRGNDSDRNWKFTRITLPVLLMAGEMDEFAFANIDSACETLVDRADDIGKPKGVFVEFTNTGHSIHDERPARLAQLLADHAKGVPIG